jgi:subtilisin family serine protease
VVKLPSFNKAKFWRRQLPRKPLLVAAILGALGVATIGLSQAATSQTGTSALDGETETIIVQYKKGGDTAALAGTVGKTPVREKRHLKRLGIRSVKVPKGQRDQVMRDLAKDPAVASVETDAVVHVAVTPTDPDYALQWYWPKISMPTVWDSTSGSSNTVVAELDSGMNTTHVDLAGQFLPGHNVIDGSSNVTDTLGHGTIIAGILAGANNNIGIVGGCWRCKVLPVKVTSTETGSLEALLAGFDYAITQNIDIVNISMVTPTESPALQASIATATNQGILTVAAAGNNGNDVIQYPAGYAGVLSVGGTDENDVPVSDSTYGSWVDIAAPGTNMVSAYIPDNALGAGHGTSFAAPVVAALAALMKDRYPAATPAQITTAITTTGDPCCTSKIANGRLNAVKAMTKLQSIMTQPSGQDTTSPTATITAPAAAATVSGTVPVAVIASDNVAVTKVELRIDGTLSATDTTSPYSFSWDSTKVSSGTHNLTAIPYDAAGNQGAVSRSVTVSNGSTTGKTGDLNKDGSINLIDLSMLLTNWNTANAIADLNGSGKVDLIDLSILLSNWNK